MGFPQYYSKKSAAFSSTCTFILIAQTIIQNFMRNKTFSVIFSQLHYCINCIILLNRLT